MVVLLDSLIPRQNQGCGLKNLGATCYMNSLLQIWYSFPAIRKAILDWVPPVGQVWDYNPSG